MMQQSDVWVMAATSTLPLGMVVCCEVLKGSGTLSAAAARKFLHVGTGLVFMLTWPLYSADPSARYIAAVLPGLMTVRFLLAGLGITTEPRLVAGTARTGRREELLAGPTLYGVSHVLLTVFAWRTNPAAAAGLAALCAGDGAADLGGRQWGKLTGKLPHNKEKTWAGSCCCFLAAFSTTLCYLYCFNYLGYFQRAWVTSRLVLCSMLSSLTAATLESLPSVQDNLLLPLGAGLTAWMLLR